MTDIEQRIQREQKKHLVQIVQSADLSHPTIQSVLQTDDRIGVYLQDIRNNPDDHCIGEIATVCHFLHKCKTYDFDNDMAQIMIDWAEFLPFEGGRITFTPIECFMYANAFGFYRKDGRRLTTECFWVVPRKFGKTTLCTPALTADFFGGEVGSSAFCVANSQMQANIAYAMVQTTMARLLPDVDFSTPNKKTGSPYTICRNSISYVTKTRSDFIRCIPFSDKALEGQKPTLVIIDEFAEAKDTATSKGSKMKGLARTGMLQSKDPMMITITTAGTIVDGPCVREMEGIKKWLYSGDYSTCENDHHFCLFLHPDVDDDYGDPHTWHKVQPHINIIKGGEEFYKQAWADAQMSADIMTDFLTKQLNVFVMPPQQGFIPEYFIERIEVDNINPVKINNDILRWKANGKQGNRPHHTIKDVSVGMDFSDNDDLTAITFTWRSKSNGTYLWTSFTLYFLPEETIRKHANRALYADWVKDGFLIPCGKFSIDMDVVFDTLWQYCSNVFQVYELHYDPKGALEIVNKIKAKGKKSLLHPFSQTAATYNPIIIAMRNAIMKENPQMFFVSNPITKWCFNNVVIQSIGAQENRYPTKIADHSPRKIDGVVSTAMSLGKWFSV